jgi:SHS2 domain-containing protein
MEEFEFLEEVATGDVAMVARGASLEALFKAAARGLSETMVETRGVRPDIAKEIALVEESLDRLLYQWLSELIYLKDAESLLFSLFEISIERGPLHRLKGVAMGERIDPSRHLLRNDVKAMTLHRFQVGREKEAWKATMIFDI